MNIDMVILTFDLVGKVLIGYAALRVHHRVLRKHRIDESVFKSMKREQRLGVLGILFIVVAYVLHFV